MAFIEFDDNTSQSVLLFSHRPIHCSNKLIHCAGRINEIHVRMYSALCGKTLFDMRMNRPHFKNLIETKKKHAQTIRRKISEKFSLYYACQKQ